MTLPGLGRMEHVLSEHQIIRNAIEAHDMPAACAAMKQHLNAVIPDIETLKKSHPGSFV